MSLSSGYLDAFHEVCRTRNFSEAAAKLSITQSALSQRIMNLENELGVTLLLREKGNVSMTEFGEKLLAYCEVRRSLEGELLSELQQESSRVMGELRVGGFSTIMRSRILPLVQKILRSHPEVQVELMSREMRELPELLRTGEAQFAFLNAPIERAGFANLLLGHEENVLIESVKGSAPEDVYIDHDKEDLTTFDFFRIQKGKPSKYRRIFFDEIYAIIDAVELGLGRAVVPRHLIENNRRVRILSEFRSLRVPVYLCYKEKPYYTELQKAFLALVEEGLSLN